MNYETITLGDSSTVLITYDTNGRIISFSSQNPLFLYVVGDGGSINIGPFLDANIADIKHLLAFIADQLGVN